MSGGDFFVCSIVLKSIIVVKMNIKHFKTGLGKSFLKIKLILTIDIMEDDQMGTHKAHDVCRV